MECSSICVHVRNAYKRMCMYTLNERRLFILTSPKMLRNHVKRSMTIMAVMSCERVLTENHEN